MRLFRQTIKVLLFVAILCFASTILIAKGTAESTLSTPAIVFADSRGVMIELQQAPRRIVSLSPNVTETLFALGLGDAVVGRTDYCDFPTEAAVVASMGDLFSPSVEKILSMEPDLVIISTLGQAQTITAVEATGVPIAFLNGSETMEGTYHLINGIGELTGTKSKAQALVASMRQDIASINAKIAGESVPSVYYVTSSRWPVDEILRPMRSTGASNSNCSWKPIPTISSSHPPGVPPSPIPKRSSSLLLGIGTYPLSKQTDFSQWTMGWLKDKGHVAPKQSLP
jgi:ABC-type Fe3+-hydroxamate transport system substrate-binding protein